MDGDLLTQLESMPEQQRAGCIRRMLRLGLNGDPAAWEVEE